MLVDIAVAKRFRMYRQIVRRHFVPWTLRPMTLCPVDTSSGDTLSRGHFVRQHFVPWTLRLPTICPVDTSSGDTLIRGHFVCRHFVPLTLRLATLRPVDTSSADTLSRLRLATLRPVDPSSGDTLYATAPSTCSLLFIAVQVLPAMSLRCAYYTEDDVNKTKVNHFHQWIRIRNGWMDGSFGGISRF